MSIIKDTLFGGAEKAAAKKQERAIREAQDITRESQEQARGDLFKLFPAAQQQTQQGFQGALDVLGQSLPAQTGTFQQGNVGAQQAILAGLPQIQNALLGNQVDLSQLQPFQVQQPDLSFFQQQLPETINPFAPQTNAQMGVGGVLPPNDPFIGPLTGQQQPAQQVNNPLAGLSFMGDNLSSGRNNLFQRNF